MNSYRVLRFIATVATLISGILLIDSNLFSQREQFQESDYIMTFYVAGHLVATGRVDELFPGPNALSFIDSPFDRAAHALLPHLQKHSTAAYMYIPLVAGLFAPLSYLDPNWSLLVWQILSVLALGYSCYLLARITQSATLDTFFFSFLFFPIFLTLWAGQLGLVFGLLPLCAGYRLVTHRRDFLGGLIWSILLLKPQFFLAAVFVAISLSFMRQHRAFIGMTTGVCLLVGLTTFVFGTALTAQWLFSHSVSDATYSSGLQGIPSHLITGLPANLMILFPVDQRNAVKIPLYIGAASLWMFGLRYCYKLTKSRQDRTRGVSLVLIFGLLLCSVTLPHLLYYDLCLLLPVGAILLSKDGPLAPTERSPLVAILGWVAVSSCLPLLLTYSKVKWPPLALELLLLILLSALLWQYKRDIHPVHC